MIVLHKPYRAAKEDELVEISKGLTRDTAKKYLARPDAVLALARMISAAAKDGVLIVVISSHRTLDFQKAYFREAEAKHGKGKGARWVAPEGYSEHHTGHAFDLADKGRPETDDEPSFESTPASDWLKANAGRFGFELSFPKGNCQGVGFEPWHWRFTGSPEAKKVFHPFILRRCSAIMKSMLKAFGLICAVLFLRGSSASAETVQFKTDDGITLEGEYLPAKAGKPTLVLLHGYLSNRPEWEQFAEYANSKGIGVFYYDLRGHGNSQGLTSDMDRMVADLDKAVETLKLKFDVPQPRIAVGGASIGANIALKHFSHNLSAPFVILLSPGLNFQGFTTPDLIPSCGSRPVLMAASTGDRYAFSSVNTLEKIARKGQNVTVLRQASSGAHGVQLFKRSTTSPNDPSDFEKKIVKWIESNAK
ncbi:MAG: hypothetical protein A3A86_00830 [Elusimicrobia bacterium RIFCSPLOWO2_01_FULL_60_11]|nr:MAG: hypothetical protein A3A86_00830 [Elusimicrobia bacterium RIFCSPLOWO2_01_FULL_60_11]